MEINRSKQLSQKRRPWEFSKKLAAWAVAVATLSSVVSYVLAFRDQQTASDVTTTIFTACIGYLVSYAAKSATEKISRNRHGLDADGVPYETVNTGAPVDASNGAPCSDTATTGKG